MVILDYEYNMAFLNDAMAYFSFMYLKRLAVAGGCYGAYMEIWIISRHQKLNAAVVGRCFYNRRLFSGTGDNGNLFDHIEFGDKLAWEATECCLEGSPAHYSEH